MHEIKINAGVMQSNPLLVRLLGVNVVFLFQHDI